MTKEEFKLAMEDITNNLSDQGKVTSTLANLYNNYETIYDEKETISTLNKDLKKENADLKAYNFDLFRQVGQQNKEMENTSSKELQDDKEEVLSYEDLFNEKGELK